MSRSESINPSEPCCKRLWSDRIKQLEQPLFPGYLFLRLDLNSEIRIKLIRIRQVIDFVGKKQGCASHVPESQIDSLRLLLSSDRLLEPTSKLVSGTEVMISQGPLKGALGVIEREPFGKRRIVVQIPLLGRGVRTELSVDDVLSYEELVLTSGDRQGALL